MLAEDAGSLVFADSVFDGLTLADFEVAVVVGSGVVEAALGVVWTGALLLTGSVLVAAGGGAEGWGDLVGEGLVEGEGVGFGA